MKKILRIIYVFLLVGCITSVANADRGVFGKKKNKVQLNIITSKSLKKSVPFNLKSGLTFRGSTFTNAQQIGNSFYNTTLVTYKKGNTVYILPYKQKLLIPTYSAEKGYQLVIRRK